MCDCKKSKCIKQQDASGLSSSLGDKNTFQYTSFSRSSFVLIVFSKIIQGIK